MNPKDIRILRLLDTAETKGEASQRAIAEDLGVSLGLVNSFFKRYTAAGFLKGNMNSKGHVKYELTQKGLREKARLTYEYILSSYRFYKDALEKFSAFFSDLETRSIRKLVLFGVNDFAEMVYLGMKETSLEMVAVVDEEKIGQSFFEKKVESVSTLATLSFDGLLITDPSVKTDGHFKGDLSEKIIPGLFQISCSKDYWS